MTSHARRARSWKLWAALLGLPALIVLLLWGWIESVAAREWVATLRRCKELQEECRTRRPRRQVLRGESLPGNAWVDYGAALEEARRLPGKRAELQIFVYKGKEADPEDAARIVRSGSMALQHLQRGAQREGANFIETGAKIPSRRWRELDEEYLLLDYLAVSKARLLGAEGKPREGAELLLDFCQFMLDLWKSSRSETKSPAASGLWLPLEELRGLIQSRELTQADLRSLAEQLERLDAAFPPFLLSHLLELTELGHAVLSDDATFRSFIEPNGLSMKCWRYGFSARLLKSDLFRTLCELERGALGCSERPFEAACEGYIKLIRQYESSKNPLVPHLRMSFWNLDRVERERLAFLRLLRLSAHFRATGDVLSLADPLGDRFLSERTAAGLKVRSGEKAWCSSPWVDIWFEWKHPPTVLEVEANP